MKVSCPSKFHQWLLSVPETGRVPGFCLFFTCQFTPLRFLEVDPTCSHQSKRNIIIKTNNISENTQLIVLYSSTNMTLTLSYQHVLDNYAKEMSVLCMLLMSSRTEVNFHGFLNEFY